MKNEKQKLVTYRNRIKCWTLPLVTVRAKVILVLEEINRFLVALEDSIVFVSPTDSSG